MKTRFFVFAILGALFFLGHVAAPATAQLQVDVEKLSHLSFEPPDNADTLAYLGIPRGSNFRPSQIEADVIIVEIFSMYCPICQREAPKVNDMHEMVEKDPSLKGKVKILGLGIGNTPFEVEVFRKKFHVAFPLIPDENYTVEKAFSERLRTPTFVVLKKDKSNGLKLIDLHVGLIEDTGKYLRDMAEIANRK